MVSTEIERVLKDEGTFILHGDYRFIHYAKCMLDKVFGIDKFVCEFIWCYGVGGSSSKRPFSTKHDTILIYNKASNIPVYKINGVRVKDWQNIKSIADKSGYLSIDDENRLLYPTQKPKELLKLLIQACTSHITDNNINVLDCFAGSGTTAAACLDIKDKYYTCYLVDSSEASEKVIKNRFLLK